MMKTKPYTLADFKGDTFFKYPQWLWYDPELRGLSKAAKSLYMYFLNMNSLSFKNAGEYTDDEGEIYFICTRAAIREMMNCSYNQPRIYIDLLKRSGLVREKRMGCNQPNRLYLLRPETLYEKPKKPKKDPCKPHKQRIHTFHSCGYTLSNHADTHFPCTLQLDKDLYDLDLGGGDAANTPPVKTYGEFQKVKLTDGERAALVTDFGEATTAACIARMDLYCEGNAVTYKNHYAMLRKWLMEDKAAPPQPVTKPNRFANFKQRDTDWDKLTDTVRASRITETAERGDHEKT